jgi:hypothetical protein
MLCKCMSCQRCPGENRQMGAAGVATRGHAHSSRSPGPQCSTGEITALMLTSLAAVQVSLEVGRWVPSPEVNMHRGW